MAPGGSESQPRSPPAPGPGSIRYQRHPYVLIPSQLGLLCPRVSLLLWRAVTTQVGEPRRETLVLWPV